MTKILQSIPHPTYTTVERDLLVDVLKNTLINNSDIGKVEEFDGSIWNSVGGNIVDQTAANTTVDATGFNGNLTTADTNQQLVNQKFDDLIVGHIIKDSTSTLPQKANLKLDASVHQSSKHMDSLPTIYIYRF